MTDVYDKTITRVRSNAEALMNQYDRSESLLKAAMKEATPWVMGLVTRGTIPPVYNMEALATKLLAIVMATEASVAKNNGVSDGKKH